MSIYGLSIIYRDLKECNLSTISKNADFFPQFLQILRIFFRSFCKSCGFFSAVGFVVKDDIEYGIGNIIPLWHFGLNY